MSLNNLEEYAFFRRLYRGAIWIRNGMITLIILGVIIGAIFSGNKPKEEKQTPYHDPTLVIAELDNHPWKNGFSRLTGGSYLDEMDIHTCKSSNTGDTCYIVPAKIIHYKEDGENDLYVREMFFKDDSYISFNYPAKVGYVGYDDQRSTSWMFSTSTLF